MKEKTLKHWENRARFDADYCLYGYERILKEGDFVEVASALEDAEYYYEEATLKFKECYQHPLDEELGINRFSTYGEAALFYVSLACEYYARQLALKKRLIGLETSPFQGQFFYDYSVVWQLQNAYLIR